MGEQTSESMWTTRLFKKNQKKPKFSTHCPRGLINRFINISKSWNDSGYMAYPQKEAPSIHIFLLFI
jgi:hypothetical protein